MTLLCLILLAMSGLCFILAALLGMGKNDG